MFTCRHVLLNTYLPETLLQGIFLLLTREREESKQSEGPLRFVREAVTP